VVLEAQFKFGLDGSGGHKIYHQQNAAQTNNLVLAMLAPLSITQEDNTPVYTELYPNAATVQRPLAVQVGKETIENLQAFGPITRELAELKKEKLVLHFNGHSLTVEVDFVMSALDRKAADALSGCGGAYCDLCELSKDECHCAENVPLFSVTRSLDQTKQIAEGHLNEDGKVSTKPGDYSTRKGVTKVPITEHPITSVQTLHSLLRSFDWLKKVAILLRSGSDLTSKLSGDHEGKYSLWSESKFRRDISFIKESKKEIQQHLIDQTGIKVDFS
jgi:hypothetical protein